jgi:peroxiredoxin
MQDPPPHRSSQQKLPGFAKIGIAIAALVLLYYGVMAGIRVYVDTQINKSAGKPVPAFALHDLAGKPWSSADLIGKITVLNFFRSRCSNCLLERDAIARLARDADPTKVQILGIMTDRVVSGISEEMTKATLARMAYEHPIVMADQALVDAFHGAGWAQVTPVTYVVDAKGQIVRAFRGHQTFETLRSATQ